MTPEEQRAAMWQARVTEQGSEVVVAFVTAACADEARGTADGALGVYRWSARARKAWIAGGRRVCPPGSLLPA